MALKFNPTPALADEYLQLKAEQARLAERERDIKQALLALGQAEIDGAHARVTISWVAGAETFDRRALELHVPEATLALCRRTGAPSVRFSVKARVADARITV